MVGCNTREENAADLAHEEAERMATKVIRVCLDVTVPMSTTLTEVEDAINRALDEPPCEWGEWTVGSANVVFDY